MTGDWDLINKEATTLNGSPSIRRWRASTSLQSPHVCVWTEGRVYHWHKLTNNWWSVSGENILDSPLKSRRTGERRWRRVVVEGLCPLSALSLWLSWSRWRQTNVVHYHRWRWSFKSVDNTFRNLALCVSPQLKTRWLWNMWRVFWYHSIKSAQVNVTSAGDVSYLPHSMMTPVPWWDVAER